MALTRPRAAQIYDIDYKQATRVVTVANITLSGGAPSQVDGVNLSLKDRVLVTGQSTLSQNGIYFVSVVGSGSNGTWTRSTDTDTTGEILTGTIVMVTEGNIYADTQWKLITDGIITVGVTDQVWTQNYSANSISSGNSNVIVNANANVTISSAGVANVLNITSTGPIVTGNLLPSANVTYNLGSTDLRWKDLWLSNSTLYLGNITVSATDTTLTVNGANVLTVPANADILTSGNISATGNITGNYFLGNVFYANGITASKIYSGNSEVNVTTSGGNVNVSIGGTSNVAVFTTDGEYVTGLLSVTGNITSGNANIIGTTASTTKTTGALTIAGGLGVSGTAYTNRSVVQGAYGNIVLNEFTGIYNQKDTGTSLIQTTTNALSAGLGMQVTGGAGNGSQIYSTGTMDIKVGVAVRAEDTPTGGTVIASVESTGLTVTGLVSATGNITGSNLITSGLATVTGNATAGNLLTAGVVSATGNVTGDYILGNVFYANGITASKIYSGNSEVNVTSSGGNVNVSIGGTSNVLVASTDGIYITGLQSVTANVTAGNVLTAGQVSATGNVSGNNFVGNVVATTVSATANIAGGNISTGGIVSATGNVTAGNILSNGLISVTGTINSGNIYTSGGISLTGNTITSSGATLTIDPNGSGAVDGAVVIAGNLSVQGNVTYIDSNVITTNEKSITLANNVSTGSLADGAGIDVGNNDLAYWRFNNATTSWQSNIGITPAANATLNLGGTSNYWSNIYAANTIISGTETVTGNITGGNVLTGGIVSATGNLVAGNVSTAGNVAGAYLLGNASQVTGINTFNQIFVTGATTVNATGLTSNVTFAGGANIELTSDGNTITIAYTAATSGSIFATGGDMGLIANPVTSSEDLGNVTTVADTSYDLGELFTTSTFNQIDMTGFTSNINTGNLNAVGLVSAAGNVYGGNVLIAGEVSAVGNVTGNYILGNGSQLTGIVTSGGANACVTITNTNITANFTIGTGYNGLSVGPMNTANGVQVIVTPGQRWIII